MNNKTFFLNCNAIGEALSLYLFSDLLTKNPNIKLITNTNPLHPITRTANDSRIKTAYEPLLKKGQVEVVMPLNQHYDNEVECRKDSVEMVHNDKYISEYWSELYDIVFNQFNPDVVFVWNSNYQLAMETIKNGKLILHLEAGCFRWPPFYTIQMDPIGVNGNALINQVPIDDLIEPGKNYHNRYKINNVLCILQSDNDSNMKRWGKFKKSVGWIEFVRQYVPKKYNVVFKGHPGLNVNFNAVQEIVDHCNKKGYKYIHNEHDIYDLFGEFDCVITQNSSVGFEALYAGLPVISICKSIYKPLLEDQNIENTFDDNLETFYGYQDRVKAFIYFCINRYMVRSYERQGDFSIFNQKALEKIEHYEHNFRYELDQSMIVNVLKDLPKNEIIV